MSSSKQLTIRLAVQNIGRTIYFTKRWCKVTSLVTALQTRYKLSDIELSSRVLSIAVGKAEPSIDDLHYPHQSGIYRGKQRMTSYYFFRSHPLNHHTFLRLNQHKNGLILTELIQNSYSSTCHP